MRLLLDLEVLADGEAEGPGDDQAREGLHGVVVGQYRVVVHLAADGDAILGLGELGLQLAEVLVGLQLGVRLCDGEETAERGSEDPFRLRGLGGVLRLLCVRRELA